MNTYNKQAEKFLKETGTTFKAVFLKYDIHFVGDKVKRDIYKITLAKGKNVYKFDFGQSLANSGKDIKPTASDVLFSGKDIKPTAYDVLSCLTKYDPDTFEEFCSSFDFDEDSRKAEKIYNAVVEEFKQVKILWSDEEIQKLQEIN